MPGAISPATGLVKNANSTWLNGRPLHQDLERRLGRPVRLANDANCLAVSEALDGAAAGADVVFGVILGTGVGGGLVVDGRVVDRRQRDRRRVGSQPAAVAGRRRAARAARATAADTAASRRFSPAPAWRPTIGVAADGARAARRSSRARSAGDALAAAHARRAGNGGWRKSLATVINVVDPDVIVVGGGLSRIARLYERVPALWATWVFSDRVATRLVPARHGDASGVRGAAGCGLLSWPSAQVRHAPKSRCSRGRLPRATLECTDACLFGPPDCDARRGHRNAVRILRRKPAHLESALGVTPQDQRPRRRRRRRAERRRARRAGARAARRRCCATATASRAAT